MNLKLIAVLLVIAGVYLIGKSSINRLVKRIGTERDIAPSRIHYVRAVLTLIWTLLALILISINIGIGYRDIGIFFGSAVAILGIAFFAYWSILSNVTASIFVFFFFPYRVGDFVKILDGENSVEGTIREITLFHVVLNDDKGVITTYPNSLVFQKAVQIKQREKHLLKQQRRKKTTEVPLVPEAREHTDTNHAVADASVNRGQATAGNEVAGRESADSDSASARS